MDEERVPVVKRRVLTLASIILLLMGMTGVGVTSMLCRTVNQEGRVLASTKMNKTLQSFNSTLCFHGTQLNLPNDLKITICIYQSKIRIDFRQFINNLATIKGIVLNIDQWNTLKTSENRIDEAIAHALHRQTR
jgi:hypothetical protein